MFEHLCTCVDVLENVYRGGAGTCAVDGIVIVHVYQCEHHVVNCCYAMLCYAILAQPVRSA